jgi:hypothetical protein
MTKSKFQILNRINIEKIIKYLVYSFAFFLPLQTRWIIKEGSLSGGAWEYGTYSLYLTDIILIVLLVLAGWQLLRKRLDLVKKDSIFENKFFKIFLGIFLLSAFFSIFVATDKVLAIYIFTRLLAGIFVFWSIVSLQFNKLYLIWSFMLGAVLQALLGIWQFLSQSSFASKWLGMAIHNPSDLGVSVIEIGIERWLRAYGGMDHPNILGGFLVVCLLIVIFYLTQNSKSETLNSKQIPNSPQGDYSKFQIPKWYFFTSYFLLLASLFFTFSRAAWIALALGIAFLIESLFFSKKFAQLKELFFVLASGVMLIFLLSYLYGNLAMVRISGDTRLEIKSNVERISALNDFKTLARSNWLMGAGLGNYGLALYEADPDRSVWRYQPVHAAILLVWGEIGILGLMGFLGILGYLGHILIVRKNYFSMAILMSLLILMMADHWLWSIHFGVMLFWFILGIILIIEKDQAGFPYYLQKIKNRL